MTHPVEKLLGSTDRSHAEHYVAGMASLLRDLRRELTLLPDAGFTKGAVLQLLDGHADDFADAYRGDPAGLLRVLEIARRFDRAAAALLAAGDN